MMKETYILLIAAPNTREGRFVMVFFFLHNVYNKIVETLSALKTHGLLKHFIESQEHSYATFSLDMEENAEDTVILLQI